MSHKSLHDINREITETGRERISSSCDFCGADEMARNVGYAGCIYCRRGGEWGRGPVELVDRELTEEEAAANERVKDWLWTEAVDSFRRHGPSYVQRGLGILTIQDLENYHQRKA